MTEPIVLPSARRWPIFLLGIAAGAAAAAAVVAFVDFDRNDAATDITDDLSLASAPVEQRDLIEEVEWVADLTYGATVAVTAPAAGTVTATSDVGAVLRRGDVVVEIDGLSVIVFYGSVPAWRDLKEDDEGPDVQQLETNLVALGFDPDGIVDVDETFDSDTEDMVETWQESLGLEATGVFSTEMIVVVEGPVGVVSAPAVGAPVKSAEVLAQVSARAVSTTIVTTAAGAVSDLAPVGSSVTHGTLLLVIGETEVRAATGLQPIDAVDLEDGTDREFILVAENQQVGSWLVASGDELNGSRPVAELTRQTLSVVVPVELSERDAWEVAQPVEVVLPDDTIVAGVVVDVGTVAQGTGQGETPTVDVTVELLDLLPDDLPASEVTVVVAGESVLGATVVPTRALVTLAEGGFAVEQLFADGSRSLVGIETGTFDDGLVEIIDSSLAVGDLVMVPS
ncbi:MAG: peptidoglycan hydrolase-like protein with peptidoglycan-binding domain [Candidatus Aldehydirespiratoraceae bacterium]|jgi:peptidoglycan hydrolase-like protein with peptidoglycan-binding domain